MQEQPLDVRAGFDIIWRRRAFVAVLGTVGLVLGLAYWILNPPTPSATAVVLLPSTLGTSASGSTSAGAQPDTATFSAIAMSPVVQKAAGQSVSPHLTPAQVQKAEKVTASGDLLTIQATGANPLAAEGLANELANAFIHYEPGYFPGGTPRMLDAATSVSPVSKLGGPIDAAGGLAVGLIIGSAVALWRGRRDRRLRRRDDLSRALGLPVLASVSADLCSRAEDWGELIDSYEPGTVDAWSLRRLLRDLEVGETNPPATVRVVSFAQDEMAMTAGVQMAVFAAGIGISTTLLAGDQPAVEPLRAACAFLARADLPERLLNFVEPDPVDSPGSGSNLTVTVVVVDRVRPRFEMTGRDITLLAISAGFATSDDLARMALAAIDAGTILDGIVVVNPDLHDYTTGAVSKRTPRPIMATSREHEDLPFAPSGEVGEE